MFDEVYLYMLPPGHSHDLQDQAWSNMKKAFYSSHCITWEDLLNILKRAFSTMVPEVVADIYVFDWKKWFRPWMQTISDHMRWRAFKISRHPTNAASVVLQWKENELSGENFHGSAEHPHGIELLLELPPGTPDRIFPSPLDLQRLKEIPSTFTNFSPAQITWWEEVLQQAEIPDYGTASVPEDYFDFAKLSYATWLTTHPQGFQLPETYQVPLRDIQVDEAVGITAHGSRFIELFVGDLVTVRNGEGMLIYVFILLCY